ncbi:MAG TPA: sulfotransferase [Rhizomicrobium sp.]|nr:sulfotransferase [Rhizomicrobium sp.]
MSETTAEKTTSLDGALALTERLLAVDPARAQAQAEEILRAVPGHPKALLLLGTALRLQGTLTRARDILVPLVKAQPRVAAIYCELGMVLGQLGETRLAIGALLQATRLAPDHQSAWRELGDQLSIAGETEKADDAYARHIKASVRNPELLAAASALIENKLAVAERLLREYLNQHPTDVVAIRMLGEIASRLGRYEDAENLLARCLELAPGFAEARANYAGVLYRANKSAEAVAQAEILLRQNPRHPGYRNLMAAALARLGESQRALAMYESVLKEYPDQPKAWMSYGHTLKVVGRQDDCIAAYRKSIAQLPSLGEAWWSLANLKTFRFSSDDVATMEKELRRDDLSEEDRYHLHFALGKAFEDEGHYADSFSHYEKGNGLRKKRVAYDEDESHEHFVRSRDLFTPDFFTARANVGSPVRDPIFVVGLPRSGSTLIEQILSSHSQVEGTMELPDIMSIAGRLGAKKKRGQRSLYPEKLLELDAGDFAKLGEEYLERTRIQRRTGRPFFTDKMPNNFGHVGLIHLILPNAKIIDARRHPLGCCFSNFKQHFARGQGFTYDLAGMGRYYRDYVALMAHFDTVLPGRVHRVIYERMVENPENEVRALLDYCGLPFEESCLKFYENDRAVRTASSEQVRQPIYRDAVEHWQNYDAWLGPLKEALGPVLDNYPSVPQF